MGSVTIHNEKMVPNHRIIKTNWDGLNHFKTVPSQNSMDFTPTKRFYQVMYIVLNPNLPKRKQYQIIESTGSIGTDSTTTKWYQLIRT